MGVAFVPLYLKLLGIERYGLIGFFLTLQSVLGILDLGLSLTLNRELARAERRTADTERTARLLRTIELTYWSIALLAGLLVVTFASWVPGKWINSTLPPGEIVSVVRIMGVLIALQMPLALYQGGLGGLQRQVSVNLIVMLSVTVRNGGAALILWLISPSIEAYFIWQLAVTAVATLFSATLLWRLIPGGFAAGRLDFSLFKELWRFATAVSANSVVGIALTQLDKVILIKMLSLREFGYYSLASLVASFLWSIILPINTALYPRFVQLLERGDPVALRDLYHKSCQFLTVVLAPATVILALFSRELLLLWTGNAATADNSYVLVALLGIGTAINGMASVPASLQSAAGWPGLVLKTNTVLMTVLVPTLLVLVPLFGARGAALVWLAINCIYITVTVPIMHRRLLHGELSRWYTVDVALPTCAAVVVGFLGRVVMPTEWPRALQFAYLACLGSACVVAAGLTAPQIRATVVRFLLHRNAAPGSSAGTMSAASTPKGVH